MERSGSIFLYTDDHESDDGDIRSQRCSTWFNLENRGKKIDDLEDSDNIFLENESLDGACFLNMYPSAVGTHHEVDPDHWSLLERTRSFKHRSPQTHTMTFSLVVITEQSLEVKQFNTEQIIEYVKESAGIKPSEVRVPLKLRDIRQVFSGITRFSLEARDGCILVNLANIKCIVLADRTLYFLEHADGLFDTLPLPKTVLNENEMPFTAPQELCIAIRDSYMTRSGNKERIVLEILLMETCARLWSMAAPMLNVAGSTTKVDVSLLVDELSRVQVVKRDIDMVCDYINGVTTALDEILDDDDVMTLMCLSNPNTCNKSFEDDTHATQQEIEVLLECYLQEIQAMGIKVRRADETMDDLLNFIEIHLSMVRNTFLRYDIVINLIGIFFSFVAALTGTFGMNLKSGLEDSYNTFWGITLTISGISVAIAIGACIFFIQTEMKQKVLFPEHSNLSDFGRHIGPFGQPNVFPKGKLFRRSQRSRRRI